MASYAPVAPIQILEEMRKQNVLGTYHLLLAHHVLEYPERFAELFNNHKQSTIIMDNSIVELGASENDSKVLEAVKAIQARAASPHWIIPVLTDVMGDGAATRDAATTSYKWWKENAPEWPLMVVTQGSEWEDFTATVDYFLLSGKFPGIEYVGVPRVLVEAIGSRQLAVQYIEAVRPDIATHLLGFSNDVTDDVICANLPGVEGIDSAVPLRYTYQLPEGVSKLYTPSIAIPARPKDWFENGTFTNDDYINLANARKWVA